MQNHKTEEELKIAIIESRIKKLKKIEADLKNEQKLNRTLKDLRDLKIDSLICTYIAAKIKNNYDFLSDHVIASIEDLEDVIFIYNELEKHEVSNELPF
jgi:hypothetical protein